MNYMGMWAGGLNSNKQRDLWILWCRIWDEYKDTFNSKRSKSARLNDIVKGVLNREVYTGIVYLKDTECDEVIKYLQKRYKVANNAKRHNKWRRN